MITIDRQGNIVVAHVLGEFALADFQEFESMVSGASSPQSSQSQGRPKIGLAPSGGEADQGPDSGAQLNLLFDLRDMAGFTVDVAWEEIKFSRAHGHDFGKVAVLTGSQWVAWSAWLTKAIGDVELEVFKDEVEAKAWLQG